MGKFKEPSWLQANGDEQKQKQKQKHQHQHRRSLSAFPPFRSSQDAKPILVDESPPSPPASQSRMMQLASKISAEAERLETHLRNNSLPEPGLGLDAPDDFPALPRHMQTSRQEMIHAARELERLVQGPRECVRWTSWSFLDTLSLQIINNYGLAKLVPLDAPISLADLGTKTSLDATNLARTLRHAMTNHLFHEPRPGLIAHTAASRLLAQDAALQDWVGFNAEDVFPAAAKTLASLHAHPEATSPTRTGFNFAFDTVGKEPMFATFGKDAARARRMGGSMASLTGADGYQVAHFANHYDLSAVDDRGGTFVDIGGSHGFVCVELAKKWKRIKFVVQDLPQTVDSAAKPICDDASVAERIQLQAHDFFEPQPVQGADVYFLRWVMHNCSTPYAVRLLRNLVPALKPGARVVINDICLRDPGSETPWDEKLIRGMDMVMLALLNTQERDQHEFRALFAAADERFVFQGVTRTENCRMSVIEAVWDPAAAVAVDGP